MATSKYQNVKAAEFLKIAEETLDIPIQFF